MRELEEELGVGRRTVERMLAAVRQVCGEVEEVATDEREKRWRMRPNPLARAHAVSVEEVAEIEVAARRLADEGLASRAAVLRGAANKLRVAMDAAALRRAEPDVEALLASEGLAARPGPRVEVREGVVASLRHALLARRRIVIEYRAGHDAAYRDHLLEPCGLLWGARPYLLAFKPGKPDAAVWRLDRIHGVRLADEACDNRPDAVLATVAAESFGVWREPPLEVRLRFTPEAAADAAAWRFHQSQVVRPLHDGSLEVRFRAGGLDEMAYHLATWGSMVEVLAPPILRRRLARLGRELTDRHGGPS